MTCNVASLVTSRIGPARAVVGMIGRFYPPFMSVRRKGLTTFVFHDVGHRPSEFAREHNLCISPDLFRRQVDWIACHYSVIHPNELFDNDPDVENAALITFDDGWAGTFEHALPILAERGLPCIVFLNCGAIQSEPFVAAVAMMLARDSAFLAFARTQNLAWPFHLTLTPALLAAFEAEEGAIPRENVSAYQGRFATWDTVAAWDGRPDVRFGNHLYNHWNASALTPDELRLAYDRNETWLDRLKGRLPAFAFPNGQPGSCFRVEHLALLHRAGARRLFAASGGVSHDIHAPLLDRIALTDVHDSESAMWYAATRKFLRNPVDIARPEVYELRA